MQIIKGTEVMKLGDIGFEPKNFEDNFNSGKEAIIIDGYSGDAAKIIPYIVVRLDNDEKIEYAAKSLDYLSFITSYKSKFKFTTNQLYMLERIRSNEKAD